MGGANGSDRDGPVGFVDGVANLDLSLVSILDCCWWVNLGVVDHRGGWSLILVRLDCSYLFLFVEFVFFANKIGWYLFDLRLLLEMFTECVDYLPHSCVWLVDYMKVLLLTLCWRR